MTDCIFCSIATGTSPAFKIRENDDFLAFLDLFPNTKGQTLVIPKKHYDSDLFLIDEGAFYQKYLLATREVVNILKKGLGVHRVAMVMEGLGVNHLHLKLFPLYEGATEGDGLSTKVGEKADFEVLGSLQMQINNAVALN
jgi:diadenosine tetraphosphate (Ap4A) HIT family hydrolase